jgi:hypothetical protein
MRSEACCPARSREKPNIIANAGRASSADRPPERIGPRGHREGYWRESKTLQSVGRTEA